MPSVYKQMPAPQGKSLSNRYKFKWFKSNEGMHVFLAKGDNSLHWKESKHDLKSGIYLSQIGFDRAANKTTVTFTKV